MCGLKKAEDAVRRLESGPDSNGVARRQLHYVHVVLPSEMSANAIQVLNKASAWKVTVLSLSHMWDTAQRVGVTSAIC